MELTVGNLLNKLSIKMENKNVQIRMSFPSLNKKEGGVFQNLWNTMQAERP